ncbi:MAG TPA: SAF domain-containing protein, partial [Anaerolineae bacterium]|nr:SAF domain-containing protein [Anaerolineae bacterium]HOR01547.1 SAF domain-containing protein [Anaerolineae bacterium]
MQLRKGTLPLVGIVVLALITFAVVFAFFSGLSRSVEVVVARRGLAAGTRLAAEDVALKRLHASAVLDRALTTPADAVGQVLSAPRLPGDQITCSLVGDRAISGIAATLPAG